MARRQTPPAPAGCPRCATIEAAVAEALRRIEEERAQLIDGQLCYSEERAAHLLDLQQHQLRDARHDGRIKASKLWGRRVRYTRDDLLDYIRACRVEDAAEWRRQ